MKLANLWRKKKKKAPSPYGFFGNYSSWSEALKDSTSYSAAAIVSATLAKREAYLSTFNPDDCFVDERTQQLMSAIALILSRTGEKTLKVLDFGGSWGIYFYLLRRALPDVEIDWTVIETEEMVKPLQAFAEPHLRWQSQLPPALETGDKPFTLCLASGALLYVPEPYQVVERFAQLGYYFLITRTPFLDEAADKIAVQRVPPEVYAGSYPGWLFSQMGFLAAMKERGELRLRWDVPQDSIEYEGRKMAYRGYLWESR
jgi:putative methyltransferase (TIGR04325 family)